MQNVAGQPQPVQVPNYSGVNIQIFNPSVNAAGGGAPQIGAPTYATPPNYPPNYYMNNFNPANQQPQQAPTPTIINEAPKVAAEPEKKKTEKREIVQLTDNYVQSVENYLNSKDSEIRLMGAKEVLARLQEDDSRKNDKALNALVNKMLQDPSQKVKFMAMAALDSRMAAGDDLTVKLLQSLQQQPTTYGQDSLKASEILLKMSGTTVQKEFEVKDKPKKESKKA